MRAFLTPRWLGLHALLLVVLAVLGLVGRWQWDKARAVGDWQNYGYAVQWWLFAGFAVFLWVKTILDELDPERVQERQGDRSPVPPLATAPRTAPAPVTDDEDPELAAYNRYLAELAERRDR